MDMGNALTQILGIDYLKNQWLKAIDAFKSNERKFTVAYNDLLNNREKYYAAGLRAQYDLVFNKGRIIQNSVGNVINATKKIYDYFNTPSNLSAAPFIAAIPIGSIIGITALIGAFLSAYYVLNKAYVEYNIRQLPPEQQVIERAKIANNSSAPIGSGISSSLYAMGGLFLLAILLPKLTKGK